MPAPKYIPKKRDPFDDFFAADPFDPRFRKLAAIKDMRWTPLGILVQWFWWMRKHPDPAFTPILDSVRECLNHECPDTLSYLEGVLEVPSAKAD